MQVTEDASAAARQYRVKVQNNSGREGDICLYQQNPEHMSQMPLAWLTEHVHPTTEVTFEWDTQYCFVWRQTGPDAGGSEIDAGQTWPAALSGNNQVTLTYQNDAFTFTGQKAGDQAGVLIINQDGSIPMRMATVGIGMAGSPTFLLEAQPDVKLVFTPHLKYWMNFGTYQQGQALTNAESTSPVEIIFPPNFYTMTAVLNANDTWTIEPSDQ